MGRAQPLPSPSCLCDPGGRHPFFHFQGSSAQTEGGGTDLRSCQQAGLPGVEAGPSKSKGGIRVASHLAPKLALPTQMVASGTRPHQQPGPLLLPFWPGPQPDLTLEALLPESQEPVEPRPWPQPQPAHLVGPQSASPGFRAPGAAGRKWQGPGSCQPGAELICTRLRLGKGLAWGQRNRYLICSPPSGSDGYWNMVMGVV